REFLRGFYDRMLSYGFAPAAFGGQLAAALGHDALARLAQLDKPTLVATGTRDALIPPRHSRTLAATIPGARLVEIEGGTHGLPLELPDRLNPLLGGWFTEHDPPSA